MAKAHGNRTHPRRRNRRRTTVLKTAEGTIPRALPEGSRPSRTCGAVIRFRHEPLDPDSSRASPRSRRLRQPGGRSSRRRRDLRRPAGRCRRSGDERGCGQLDLPPCRPHRSGSQLAAGGRGGGVDRLRSSAGLAVQASVLGHAPGSGHDPGTRRPRRSGGLLLRSRRRRTGRRQHRALGGPGRGSPRPYGLADPASPGSAAGGIVVVISVVVVVRPGVVPAVPAVVLLPVLPLLTLERLALFQGAAQLVPHSPHLALDLLADLALHLLDLVPVLGPELLA